MIINLDKDGQMQIAFVHRQVPPTHKMDNPATGNLRIVYGLPYDIRGVTNCLITFSNVDGEKSTVGNAFCSYKDNYNKAKGRKIALKRALEDLGVNKSIRKEVWTQYLKIKTDKTKEVTE